MKREEEGMNVVDPEGVLLSEKESWGRGGVGIMERDIGLDF